MDRRNAYRICHVYPDREIPFTHNAGSVIYEGVFRRFTKKECETRYPFTVEISGTARESSTGKVTRQDIGRRFVSLEKAVVYIFNGCNENAAVRNRYNSLEDILFSPF